MNFKGYNINTREKKEFAFVLQIEKSKTKKDLAIDIYPKNTQWWARHNHDDILICSKYTTGSNLAYTREMIILIN